MSPQRLRDRLARVIEPGGFNLAQIALTAVAFMLLRHYDLIADQPVWVYLLVLGLAGVGHAIATLRWPGECSDRELYLQVGIDAAGTFAVIYSTGWGPTLAVGYMFIVAQNLKRAGARATVPTLVCGTAAVVLGQLAIGIGLAPSLIRDSVVQGLGVLVLLALAFAIHVLGLTTAAKERAEAKLRRSEARFRNLVQKSSDAIVVVRADGGVLYLSPAVEELFGWHSDDPLGTGELLHADDMPRVRETFLRLLKQPGATTAAEMRVRHKDGSWRWIDARLTNRLQDSNIGGIICNFRDVTDRKRYEEQLTVEAQRDSLTGYGNRSAFGAALERGLARGRRNGTNTAVLFLDLDQFKEVNDMFGHHVGDQVLVDAARRLAGCLRDADLLARFGGDEFVVLLEDAPPNSVAAVAERMVQALRRPLLVAGHEFQLTGSVGVAMSNGDGHSASDLLRDADVAMYAAKRKGRGQWAFFDPEIGTGVRQHYQRLAELRAAMRHRQFEVYYQPEVDLTSGGLVGYEALVRWDHPAEGLLLPSQFIPLAEESDLIFELDLHVLAAACRTAAQWQDDLKMNVNVSARSLDAEGVERLLAVIQAAGVSPARIRLEVTERQAMIYDESSAVALQAIRDAGAGIVVDDFGTGYSSLARLQALPITGLKIDQMFVREMTASSAPRAIVAATLTLAQELGLHATAEGVETKEQADALRALGCPTAQGFYFGRPAPASSLVGSIRPGDERQRVTAGPS